MPVRWDMRVVGESLLLGPDGTPSSLSAKSKTFALLVFLAVPVAGRRVRRDELLATFWPEFDPDRARSALRASLHLLRRTLGPDALGKAGESEIALDTSIVRVDFDDLSKALDSDEALRWLARPSLELVPGLHVSDAAPFMEWLDGQRQASNTRLVRAAWSLADHGDPRTALIAARAATRLAREDEVGLRRLMSLLDQLGDRVGALAEFDAFRQWCETQLDASPAPETLALAHRIRDRTIASGESPQPSPRSPSQPSPGSVILGDEPGPPSAVKSRWWRATSVQVVGVAALLVIGVASWLGAVRRVTGRDRTPIAVLPFDSQVTDSTLAYVAPALGESITDALSFPTALPREAMRGVDLRDRHAVQARLSDRGARATVRAVVRGRRDSLDVELVVSDVKGDEIRRFRWHAPERQLALLRDSAVAVVRAATGAAATPAFEYSPKPEAVQLERNAAYLLGMRTVPAMLDALNRYNRALAIDPDWPELWLGRARVYGSIAYRHGMNYRLGMLASEHDATEVLKRNGKDARAYIERAMARFHLGDTQGARADAHLAAALDTTDFHMQSLIGTWWQWTGDHLDSALFYTRRAQRLEPWDRQIALNILEIVGCMPDSVAIIAAARRVLELDPQEPFARETLAWTLTRFGRWSESADLYETLYPGYVRRGITASARRLSGEPRFRESVRALRRAEYADPSAPPPDQRLIEQRVALFEDIGMRDSSIAALGSMVDSLEAHRTNMMCGENLRAFRHDPRVQAIVKRRGWTAGEFGRDG